MMLLFFLALIHTAVALHFDTYYAYQKGNEQTFAYDARRVCKILKHSPYTYVRLENPLDQFDRTAVKQIECNEGILACLNYKGYSYLFYTANESMTGIVKGAADTRIFPIRLDRLYYDHLDSALYVIAGDACLYQINLEWSENATTTLIADKNLTSPLPVNNMADVFVVNRTVYWLTPYGKVYKQRIGTNEKTVLVYENYPDIRFSIIPFPPDIVGIRPSITITENPHIKISGLGGDSIFLPLPSSLNADFVYTTNNIFLYILDIIFFLCLVIILRIATRRQKKAAALKLEPINLAADKV